MKNRINKTCVRLSPEEEVILRKAARNSGMNSFSGFIRKCALWHANNPSTKVTFLMDEQIQEAIMQVKMLISLMYKNPNPEDRKIQQFLNLIETTLRNLLK